MSTTAIIVAAGRGTRAGGDRPKQWQTLGDRPVAAHAIAAFASHPAVSRIVLVVHPDDLDSVPLPDLSGVTVVAGGETRAVSVRAGLAAAEGATQVLIHDAARPLVSAAIIDRVLGALQTHAGAAPAVPVTDTLWRGEDGFVDGVRDRSGLFRAQTPQGFRLDALRAAHAQARGDETDDVAVARAAGLDVAIVAGDEDNMKITGPDDLDRAARLMKGKAMDIRCGNGFDVHRFCEGDHVWLCGVQVPHTRGLLGHSDADVGMHAVTDAIYGALGAGDIGQHFPPSDPKWKGAASHIFLEHAVALATKRGFSITHVDCTLICENPKIGPHHDAMKAVMGAYMKLNSDRISVKATTSEKLGFTGREEGIAAIATATLVKA